MDEDGNDDFDITTSLACVLGVVAFMLSTWQYLESLGHLNHSTSDMLLLEAFVQSETARLEAAITYMEDMELENDNREGKKRGITIEGRQTILPVKFSETLRIKRKKSFEGPGFRLSSRINSFCSNASSSMALQSSCCSICIEELEEGVDTEVLPCSHVFHSACINQWFQSNSVCPNCKHDLDIGRRHPEAEVEEEEEEEDDEDILDDLLLGLISADMITDEAIQLMLVRNPWLVTFAELSLLQQTGEQVIQPV
ncbi:unnamed protein product [Chrysoparadoxa australica]